MQIKHTLKNVMVCMRRMTSLMKLRKNSVKSKYVKILHIQSHRFYLCIQLGTYLHTADIFKYMMYV